MDRRTREELLDEIAELHRRIERITCMQIGESGNRLSGLECLEFYQSLIEAISEPILVLDSDLKCIFSNKSFNGSFNVSSDSVLGNSIYTVADGALDIPDMHKLMDELLSIHSEMDEYEVNLEPCLFG